MAIDTKTPPLGWYFCDGRNYGCPMVEDSHLSRDDRFHTVRSTNEAHELARAEAAPYIAEELRRIGCEPWTPDGKSRALLRAEELERAPLPDWLLQRLEADGYRARTRLVGNAHAARIGATYRARIERERCPNSPYLRGWDRACAELGSDPAAGEG